MPRALVAQLVPSGEIKKFAGGTVPAGYLACDGKQVSRATYNALYLAIGTAWGSGDGSTTFNLPDLRGMFVRGHSSLVSKNFATTDVNTTTEVITITAHGLNRSGVRVRFSSTTTLPGGLAINTDYWAIYVDDNSVKVASSEANALAGTAIDLTTQGTGTHTLLPRIDPENDTRTASAPGGLAGNNVGAKQEDQLQRFVINDPMGGQNNGVASGSGAGLNNVNAAYNPAVTGDFGTPRTGYETRPRNASVLYMVKT